MKIRVIRGKKLLYADLARALRALSDAGAPVSVLKRAALASTVYPSIAHRPMAMLPCWCNPSRTTALKVEALWERARPLRLEGAATWPPTLQRETANYKDEFPEKSLL